MDIQDSFIVSADSRVDVSCAPDTRVHARSLQGCLAKIFPPHSLYFERSGALLILFTWYCKTAKSENPLKLM